MRINRAENENPGEIAAVGLKTVDLSDDWCTDGGNTVTTFLKSEAVPLLSEE